MLLRHYLEQGASKSALARQLGVSRETIHRWIRDGDLDRDLDATPVRYGPRRAVPTKLDAYKPIIETRLAAYPQLSAVRLLAEIRAAGFDDRLVGIELGRHRRPRPIAHGLLVEITLEIARPDPPVNRVATDAQLASQRALARAALQVMPE